MNYYFMGKSNGRRMLIRVSLLRTVDTEKCDDDDMVNDSFADYTSELFSRLHHYFFFS